MAISDLILGTMYFGTKTDEATSFEMLDAFVAAGGTTLDTADAYAFWVSESGSGGQSEAVLGRWLVANPGVREQLSIATKVGVEPVVPGDFTRPEGLSATAIAAAFKGSQERLGIDCIDVYFAHAEDRETDLAETVQTLGELAQAGQVGRLGVSNHPAWRVERARALAAAAGLPGYEVLQLTTSYFSPRPDTVVPGKDHRFGFATDETRDFLAEHPEMQLWVYSPLVQGSYDRADRPFPEVYEHPGTTRRSLALTAVADRLGVTRGQVVSAWLVAQGHRPIIGVSSPEQLREALVGGRLALDPDTMAALDAPR